MAEKKEPLIIIVSAPSGSGKTTIVNNLLGKMENITKSISCTTRKPREDEKDGEDYIFIPKEEFIQKAENGAFLEWEKNFDEYYGTSRDQVEEALAKGEDIILSIDVKGARSLKKHYPESISVFIMPPSAEELEARLRKRNTDREQQVSMRLKESKQEVEAVDEYDYLVVNEDIDKSVDELKSIIEEEKKRRKALG